MEAFKPKALLIWVMFLVVFLRGSSRRHRSFSYAFFVRITHGMPGEVDRTYRLLVVTTVRRSLRLLSFPSHNETYTAFPETMLHFVDFLYSEVSLSKHRRV